MHRQLTNYSSSPTRQTGAALFVSLIFLLVLTMIALSSMNNTLMDSKIVNNQQDKAFATLMADAVMKEPEVYLQGRKNRLDLEYGLCEDDTVSCTQSKQWAKRKLDWTASVVTDPAQWWGDPEDVAWTASDPLPMAYGTNGGTTYCAGKPNEKIYGAVPSSIDDGNNFNNCLANLAIPPTYIVQEASYSGGGGGGSTSTRSLEADTGGSSNCSLKKNDYYWETTVQASGARNTTKSMVRTTYNKKC